MKKLFFLSVTIAFLCSCNSKKSDGITTTSSSETSSGSDQYFDFTIDGKEMHINADDISCTYTNINNHVKFTKYAGKEGSTQVMLTIPRDMTAPSVTPSGSPDYAESITQGSVSLQDYPEKGYTTNSFNSTYPEKSPIIPQAIVILSTEKDGDKARIITGSFNAKTYGDDSHSDPKSTDHLVTGKFKIRHEFSSINGGAF